MRSQGNIFVPPAAGAAGKKPFSYYQDLRQRPDVGYETRKGSKVVQVYDGNESLRLLQLESFMPLSVPITVPFGGEPTRLIANDAFVYWEAAALLAMNHFNERDFASVLPKQQQQQERRRQQQQELSERLEECDLYLTMRLHDTQINPLVSSKALYPMLFLQNHSLSDPSPGAVVGTVLSKVSQAMAVLAGVGGIPLLSPAASSSSFDTEHDNVPTFARTVPGNIAFARASVQLLKYWGVSHAACVYPLNEFGTTFLQEVVNTANAVGVELVVSGYPAKDNTSTLDMMATINKVRSFRYIIAVANGQPEEILVPAYDVGMVSEEYTWIIPQAGDLVNPRFTLSRSRERYAKALNGAAVVDFAIEPNPSFSGQVAGFRFNPLLQDFYVKSHAEPHIFDRYNWTESIPILTAFAYTSYDAVMAMGIAACDAQQHYFSGQQHYEQLKMTEFLGVSGRVNFDGTGSRQFEGLQYGYTNILIDEETSTNDTIRFKSRVSLVLAPTTNSSSELAVREVVPFVFHSGSTEVPPALPPVEVELNLISRPLQLFGWLFGGLVALLALALGIWTYTNRKKKLMRLSQPIFLGMMCFGAFLMASSILFLGWQEPWQHLDFACMTGPWLLSLGFSTAFSALFAKTWRINRLFKSAAVMRSDEVHARNVLWPFVLMTFSNVAVLTSWTLIAPQRWIRRGDGVSFDQYGRSTESSGYCKGEQPMFWIVLVAFNFIMVAFANYQSYLGRNAPSDFNESLYVAVAMASLLECFLIGAPITFLVAGNPSAEFVLHSVLIATGCVSILLPIYFHKFRTQKISTADVRASISFGWSSQTDRQRRFHSASLSDSSTELRGPNSVARIRARARERYASEDSGPTTTRGQEFFRPNRGLRACIPDQLQSLASTSNGPTRTTSFNRGNTDTVPVTLA